MIRQPNTRTLITDPANMNMKEYFISPPNHVLMSSTCSESSSFSKLSFSNLAFSLFLSEGCKNSILSLATYFTSSLHLCKLITGIFLSLYVSLLGISRMGIEGKNESLGEFNNSMLSSYNVMPLPLLINSVAKLKV